MLGSSTFAPLLLALSPSVLATTYSITDTYVGPSFLAGFDHIAVPDPTHGRVKYVVAQFCQLMDWADTRTATPIRTLPWLTI